MEPIQRNGENYVTRQEGQFTIFQVMLMVGTIAVSAAPYTWYPTPFSLCLPIMVGLIWLGKWLQGVSDRLDHRFIDDRTMTAKTISVVGSILLLVGLYYVLAFTVAHLMMFVIWASDG